MNDDDVAKLMAKKRVVHAATPLRGVDEALAAIETEKTGVPDSDFSVIKLFIVSAALRAFAGTDEVLRRAAWRAGRAWDESRRAERHHPTYFCAEWVSIVYGAEFTLADFEPPPAPAADTAPSLDGAAEHPDADDASVLGIDVDELLDWARSVPRRVEETEERWAAVFALAAELHRRAPGFIRARFGDLGELFGDQVGPVWQKLKKAAGVDQPVMVDVSELEELTPTTIVPASLVTPRMIATASWVGEVRRVV